MLAALQAVAESVPTAIVSGRDVVNAKDMIGIEGIYYAGSHGFDVIDPEGGRSDQPPARDYLMALDGAEAELRDAVAAIEGAWVERKRFAIAVHYRQTPEDRIDALDRIVADVVDGTDDLRRTGGKKIFELRPNFDWDKGKAVLSLLDALGLDSPDVCPIYVGDDVTDEDAFRALQGRGIGVVVEGADERTFADLGLPDVASVGTFLRNLLD